ncbi:MAG: hypothetical protein GXY38_04050 [Planctomycetes bacterium]|nr:hypothetical protein [Planctomycetota bacterium]
MRKLCAMLCLAGVVLAGAANVLAQDVRSAQKKAMTLRAARVDGIRKLAERIKGLQITSETRVSDFITQSDEIQTAMQTWMAGMREKGSPVFNDDGTVEVKMEVTLEELILNLKQVSSMCVKGNKFKAQDFEQMTVTNKQTVITETGVGAPPMDPPGAQFAPVPSGGTYTSGSLMSAKAKELWGQLPPNGRLMALRAARVDAMRRLGERLNGTLITSETSVRDFIAESDEVNTRMETFLAGARETAVKYHDDELIVEVEMSVTLQTVYASLKSWGQAHYKGDKVKLQKLEELSVTTKDTVISETGMGVPPEPMVANITVTKKASAPDWISRKISAVGNAALDDTNPNAAQAKLMALRGAELDARRKLSEQISGLMISSSTSVQDFITQDDRIKTAMMDFQVGATVVESSKKIDEDGVASVEVEIDLQPVWDTIVSYQSRYSLQIK